MRQRYSSKTAKKDLVGSFTGALTRHREQRERPVLSNRAHISLPIAVTESRDRLFAVRHRVYLAVLLYERINIQIRAIHLLGPFIPC